MTTYIAGPMKGFPDKNYPAFEKVTQKLRNEGIEVLSPHEVGPKHGETYEWYIREDLKLLLQCDNIVMLPGWKNSKGAVLEHSVAVMCGMKVREWSE